MPDEFPTLEAVAALGVVALLIRTLLVASEMRSLPRFTSSLARSLADGERNAALAACNAPVAPALARSARELITFLGDPPYGPDALADLKAEQSELEQDLTRRAENGRARDLIVLAVLLGSMAFAILSSLAVTTWFHALAALAALLLVIGFVARSWLRRLERAELARIGEALANMLHSTPSARSMRHSLHSMDGGCTVCGETQFLIAQQEKLGPALPELGIHELRICKNCGFVSGQAEDRLALAHAELEERNVAVEHDAEASSDDTEHDG